MRAHSRSRTIRTLRLRPLFGKRLKRSLGWFAIEFHPEVACVFALSQTHHLQVSIVSAQIAIEPDLAGGRAQIVVGHSCTLANRLGGYSHERETSGARRHGRLNSEERV